MKQAACLLIALCVSVALARADGGAVIAQEITEHGLVTVFGEPAPFRAGPADLSVMLQDPETDAPILDQSVSIAVTAASDALEAWVPPCCSMESKDSAVRATHSKAQNKLLYQANVIIPAAGPVDIVVRIGAPAEAIVAQIEARPPLPPAAAYWPYLLIPPVAIGAFAVNQHIRRR